MWLVMMLAWLLFPRSLFPEICFKGKHDATIEKRKFIKQSKNEIVYAM